MKTIPVKLLFTFIILFVFIPFCKSQKPWFKLELGIGSYQMDNLKKLNSYVQEGMPFHTEVTADFPVFPYFRASAFLNFKGTQAGLAFSYHSTGSRVSASDYSAEYRFDNLLKAYMPGVFVTTPLIVKTNLHLEGRLESGAIFSNMKNIEYFSVYDSVLTNTTVKLQSINAYVEPGLHLSYPLGAFILGAYTGYMIQLGNKGFYINGNLKSQVLNPATQTVLKPGWNGFRLNISVAFQFKSFSRKTPLLR